MLNKHLLNLCRFLYRLDIDFFILFLENLTDPAKPKRIRACIRNRFVMNTDNATAESVVSYSFVRLNRARSNACAQAEGTFHFDPVCIIPIFCFLVCLQRYGWPPASGLTDGCFFPTVPTVPPRPIYLVRKDPLWITARPFPETLRCSLKTLAFIIGLIINLLWSGRILRNQGWDRICAEFDGGFYFSLTMGRMYGLMLTIRWLTEWLPALYIWSCCP